MMFSPPKLLRGLLILAVGLSVALPAVSGPPPRWPLDLPTRYLTSGFMEYRPGRYHAGLDLKTGGRTGFPVHAAEDGSIVRVRATARAYGRAVYLQTPGGKTYVYAHLSRFNDKLRAEISRARRKSGTYRCELYFEPGYMPVQRGEVLGLTGQSGTAGPHLHFEVRDGAQHPLNPLAQGFAVPDTFPPVISAVHAIPMTPAAVVGGRHGIMVTGHPDGPALPDTLPELAITGPVAFTARMIDHADIRGYRLEPERVTVLLDGREVYRAVNTTFSFDQGNRSRLEWYTGLSPRERWLHRRPADDVAGRRGDVWPLGTGEQGLPAGRHVLVLRAADQDGNTAQVVLPLMVGGTAVSARWRPDSLATLPGVPLVPDGALRVNPFFCTGLEDRGWSVQCLDPAHADPVLVPASLYFRSTRPPTGSLVQALAQHLEPTAVSTAVWTADLPLTSSLTVPFGDSLPEWVDMKNAWVFRWDGGSWQPSGGLLHTTPQGSSFKLSSPGLYAVFVDRREPVLTVPGAEDGVLILGPGAADKVPGVTPPRWEVFPVVVTETGAGVDPASVTATLDGAVLVPEPDLPRSRLLVELPADVPPGSHDLTIALADKCGNEATLSVTLRCLDPKQDQEKR